MDTLAKKFSFEEVIEDVLGMIKKLLLTALHSLFLPATVLKNIYSNKYSIKPKEDHLYVNYFIYILVCFFITIGILKARLFSAYNSVHISIFSNVSAYTTETPFLENMLHLIPIAIISVCLVWTFFWLYDIGYWIRYLYAFTCIWVCSKQMKLPYRWRSHYYKKKPLLSAFKVSLFYFIGTQMIILVLFDLFNEIFPQKEILRYSNTFSRVYSLYLVAGILFFVIKISRKDSIRYPYFLRIIRITILRRRGILGPIIFTSSLLLFLMYYVPIINRAALKTSFSFWGTLSYKHKVSIDGDKGQDTLQIQLSKIDSSIKMEVVIQIQNFYPYEIWFPQKKIAILTANGSQIDNIPFFLDDTTSKDFFSIQSGQVATVKLKSFIPKDTYRRVQSIKIGTGTKAGFSIKPEYLPADEVEKDYSKKIAIHFNSNNNEIPY